MMREVAFEPVAGSFAKEAADVEVDRHCGGSRKGDGRIARIVAM
jgi:hypothetical protein